MEGLGQSNSRHLAELEESLNGPDVMYAVSDQMQPSAALLPHFIGVFDHFEAIRYDLLRQSRRGEPG